MNVKYGIAKAVSLCVAFSYTLYRSLKKLISLSDIAHFAVRLSPYQGAIWCFSAPEMGFIASRNGAFCNAARYSLNLSYWYSTTYANLL